MLFLVSCSKRIVHRFLTVSQIKRLGGLLGGRETMTVLYTNLMQGHKTVQCFDVVVIWDSTGWKPVLRRVSCFSKCIIVKKTFYLWIVHRFDDGLTGASRRHRSDAVEFPQPAYSLFQRLTGDWYTLVRITLHIFSRSVKKM